jgi:p-hydroxybenzoate 3-monooxygenase
MQYGHLFLVGDAAHIVPPTGAKGSTWRPRTSTTCTAFWSRCTAKGASTCLQQYSPLALRRVWKGERFSWFMTQLLHDFGSHKDAWDQKMQEADREYFLTSQRGW